MAAVIVGEVIGLATSATAPRIHILTIFSMNLCEIFPSQDDHLAQITTAISSGVTFR